MGARRSKLTPHLLEAYSDAEPGNSMEKGWNVAVSLPCLIFSVVAASPWLGKVKDV